MTRDELLARYGVSRRQFLTTAGTAAAAVTVGCAGGGTPPPPPVDAGPPDAGCEPSACLNTAKTLLVSLAEHPALNAVGGFVVVSDASFVDPLCGQDQIIVVQPSAGTFVALSASCSHNCCIVGYDASLNLLVCPCHGSRYDLSGAVVRGPAPLALPTYETCADACNVYVNLAEPIPADAGPS